MSPPFPGFPATFQGTPLSELPELWIRMVVGKIAKTGSIPDLHRLLEAGLDIKRHDAVLWCVSDIEYEVDVGPCIDIAEAIVREGGSVRGSFNGENVLRLLVDVQRHASRPGLTFGPRDSSGRHVDTLKIFNTILGHAPREDLLTLSSGKKNGISPLQRAIGEEVHPVVPVLVAIHEKAGVPVHWRSVFRWLASREKKDFMDHQALSLENIIDQFEALGAPIEGTDDVPSLASLARPDSEVGVLLARRQRSRFEATFRECAPFSSGARLRL